MNHKSNYPANAATKHTHYFVQCFDDTAQCACGETSSQVTPPKPIDTAKHEVSKPAAGQEEAFCTYPSCTCLEQGLGDCGKPLPQAEPIERAGIKINLVTWQDAVAGLERIFADLRSPDRFHDQWDWMKAGFYLNILKAEIEESQPSTLPQSSQQARGFEELGSLEDIAVYIESDSECLMDIVIGETKREYGVRLLKVMANELRQRFGKKEQ